MINAFFELFGHTFTKEEYQKFEMSHNLNEYKVDTTKNKWDQCLYYITPHFNSKEMQEKLSNIKFACISYSYYADEENAKSCSLRSERTPEDEKLFCEVLSSINYDESYGTQQLFGAVVFKDETWLTRGEYDGSEWWIFNRIPTEEDIFND